MAEDTIKEVDQSSILDDNTAATLLQEVTQGYREWEYDDKKFRSRFPSAEEDSQSRVVYAKQFNKNLVEGLLTTKQMVKLLEDRGIWTDEDDKEVDALREKIGSIEVILSKKDVKDKSKTTKKFVEELAENRVKLFEKTGSYQEYINQTVENLADERRTAYLISVCTETVSGSPVWATMEEFLREKDMGLVNSATYEYVTFTNGLAENYVEDLTEVKFLRAGIDEDGTNG